jgi:hypothetical protein
MAKYRRFYGRVGQAHRDSICRTAWQSPVASVLISDILESMLISIRPSSVRKLKELSLEH